MQITFILEYSVRSKSVSPRIPVCLCTTTRKSQTTVRRRVDMKRGKFKGSRKRSDDSKRYARYPQLMFYKAVILLSRSKPWVQTKTLELCSLFKLKLVPKNMHILDCRMRTVWAELGIIPAQLITVARMRGLCAGLQDGRKMY